MDLEGFPAACTCTGAACDTPSNSCGIHIHFGTSCASATNVQGHYYNSEAITTDPWNAGNGAYYNTDADDATEAESTATLTKDYGYTLAESEGKVIAVHNNVGGKIGCGVLK